MLVVGSERCRASCHRACSNNHDSHKPAFISAASEHRLRCMQGELSLDNERKLHALMRKFETEILAAADVVCVTCIGAGDKRLKRFNFPIVRSLLISSPKSSMLGTSTQLPLRMAAYEKICEELCTNKHASKNDVYFIDVTLGRVQLVAVRLADMCLAGLHSCS
jgi:hypothetical protein